MTNTGEITASGTNAHAMYVTGGANAGEISIVNTGRLSGSATGIFLDTSSLADRHINNAGSIEALSDQAVAVTSTAGATVINNTGTITGSVQFAGDVTVHNGSSSSWNIRHFADTDSDGIRDTKAVAVSDFGAGSDSRFVNESSGTVRLAAVSGEQHVTTTGEYLPSGTQSISNAGTVQGQLLNLQRFEHSGTIDLTSNQQAGDVLVISGGSTPGTYRSGTYVSNGGSLLLDVVMNQGGADTSSDQLVVDDVVTGAGGATRLFVHQSGGTGALTEGNGIQVVEVLGQSGNHAFTLAGPLTVGAYEYILQQGANDQNWYLSSRLNKNVDPPSYIPLINPAVGAYLANRTAAQSMFQHTLFDRQGQTNGGSTTEKQSVWIRVTGGHSEGETLNGRMDTSTDDTLVHFGGDVYQRNNAQGTLHVGLMAAYGQSETDVTSKATHTRATGKVDGYSVGAYGTWFADEAGGKGLYVDGWAQYGWFNNKVSGQAQQRKEESYDSALFSLSLEAGYGVDIGNIGQSTLMLTPQAQVTYNRYRADDHQDGNSLRISDGDNNGVLTRLGARLHGTGSAFSPFVEVNWLYGSADDEMRFNTDTYADDMPDNRVELKLGAQGTIAKNWKVWGQFRGQWGSNRYDRYEGQVGVNYQW